MNVLVMTSYPPHRPTSGAALRNWQNISALSSLGFVDVVSVSDEQCAGLVDGVREWIPFALSRRTRWDRFKKRCWILRAGVYPGIDAYHLHAVSTRLRACGRRRRYGVAVIETISMASYLADVRRVADRVVFDAHNVEASLHAAAIEARAATGARLIRRIKDRVLNARIAAAERRAVRGADLVWACSEADAAELERAYGVRGRVAVVPNGVDVDAYRRPGVLPAGADWSSLPITILYPGMFSYSPNEDAALRLISDVLPTLRARGCQARLVLVGRDPTRRMIAAARQAEGIEVTGAVADVVSYLEQPCVVTLPIRLGSGTRLKILEAFAVGRPVVSSAKGAEGIDADDGEHLLIRNDPTAMAEAVVELWNRPLARARLCANALELVRTRYSWSVAAARIASNLGLQSPTALTLDQMRRSTPCKESSA